MYSKDIIILKKLLILQKKSVHLIPNYIMANLHIPEDLISLILDEQCKHKKEKRIGKFSLLLTIWKLLRELKELRENR